MASKEHYEFFKFLYEEEVSRYSVLGARAQLYISVIGFFVGAVVFKASDLGEAAKVLKLPLWLLLTAASLFIVALSLVVLAMWIRSYQTANEPEKVLNEFIDTPPDNEEFFDNRIIDFAVAATENAKENNRVANCLLYAGYALSAAIVGLLIILMLAILPGHIL